MNNKKLHDELFKATFSMVSEVIAFSKIYLPKWLDNKLDYSTLQHEPTSFVGEQLSEYFSDIIYSCRLIDGKSIKLTFLLEHKSYVPKNIYIQLLRYLTEIYDGQFKNENSLTLVIPVVVYHGKEKWQRRIFSDYFDLPDTQFHQYLPFFNYELIDLRHISNDLIIQQSVGHYLKSTFLVFKHKNDKAYIEQFSEEIFIFVNETLDETQKLAFLRNMLTYIFGAFKYQKEEFQQYVQKISNMTSETINLGEILFGEEFTTAVNKEVKVQVKAQVKAQTDLERTKAKKQQIFLQLKNLLNLIKQFPALKDEAYAKILEGITPILVKKTKLALTEKKRVDTKKQLNLLFFKPIRLTQKDQKELSKMITAYFKKEAEN